MADIGSGQRESSGSVASGVELVAPAALAAADGLAGWTPPPAALESFRTLGWWLSLAEQDRDSVESRGAAAALRFALAQMLDLSPVAAAELSFIRGRLVLSAQLVRALAMRRGYRVVPVERSDESCTAALCDAQTGEELGRTTYSMDEARRAKLVRAGGGYETNPARMLWARASKRVVDDFAPEVSLGITTPEESDEIRESAAAIGPNAAAVADVEPAASPPTPPAAGETPEDEELRATAAGDLDIPVFVDDPGADDVEPEPDA